MNWRIEQLDEQLLLEGEIDSSSVDLFCAELTNQINGHDLHLLDLDILDGVAMAKVVTALRKFQPIRLFYAPQMLAHTLYKCGLLHEEGFELVFPREDEN